MISVPPAPDHSEVDAGVAAGVSDRGLRHLRNEDAMALASQQTQDGLVVVAVVCDGVSSSPRPDEAAQAAAAAVGESSPIDDVRATAWYRRKAGTALVARALAQAAGL